MAQAKLEFIRVGMIQTNCYFLTNTETKECVIVDAGGDAPDIIRVIEENEYKPVAIILTHGHFDHILGVLEVKAHFDIPVYAHEEEIVVLNDKNSRVLAVAGDPKLLDVVPDVLLEGEECDLTLAGINLKVFNTPGHTIGSVCYYDEADQILISGDTLFQGSVGRTDFPTGSTKEILHSVNDILMKLPDEVAVFPGHGPATTIGNERRSNPYVR